MLQRTGDGVSPGMYFSVKITFEHPTEMVPATTVGSDDWTPLQVQVLPVDFESQNTFESMQHQQRP